MRQLISLPTFMLILGFLGSANCLAQGGPVYADSVLVDNVKIWYPGEGQTGNLSAELWWHQPDWPAAPWCNYIVSAIRHLDYRLLELSDMELSFRRPI